MRYFAFVLTLPTLFLSTLNASHADEQPLTYPETRSVDVIDEYHGVKVPDPYRWLEQDVRESEEVAEWVSAQNAVARKFLDAISERPAIHERLAKLWNFERYTAPWTKGGRYFYYKNDGLQDQSVLYWSDSYDGNGQVLIDPNKLSEDGTVSLGQVAVSDDGSLAAYCQKEAGSDWSTIYVREIESGRKRDDVLKWVRWGNIVWNAEGTGFYYSRYPEPPEGEQYQAATINQMAYLHTLGQRQEEDQLVFRIPEEPTRSFGIGRTDDNRYLILTIYRSTDPQNQVRYRTVDAAVDAPWTPIIGDFENEFQPFGNEGSKLLFLTDFDAPTKRIVAIDVEQSPSRESAQEVVPAREATLEGASYLDGTIICQFLQDVVSRVERYDIEGKLLGEIELPGVGSASGFSGQQTDQETFYTFASYTTPPSIFRYDLTTGDSARIRAPQIDFDPDQFESRQAFYQSKDGTRIPIIVSHRKGIELTGDNPTLLYAYGGFNISITPTFSVEYATWMNMGGVVAVANLRGGGEYGEPWHLAGKKQNKQNVFDDFIAAAQWLIDQKYTKTEKLAIMGGSNGGLLVGSVMTQRPELFGACLPAVGVMDMLRFDQFTAGHFWRDEFGSSENADEFPALLAYSPYHNIKDDTVYPATMITTADTDDRVVPMHSFKFGARLQQAQAGPAPILLRVEQRAGHGAGTPISKRIDQAADRWAFLWKVLEMGDE